MNNKMTIDVPNEYVEWTRNLFQIMEDGGRWGVPRTGIVLEKRGEILVLLGRMQERDKKRLSALRNEHRFKRHGKLSVDEEAILSKEQRLKYQSLRVVLERAGITVEDHTGESPYVIMEHGTIVYGIVKHAGGRNISKRLGTVFDLQDAAHQLTLEGFDLANMTLLTGSRSDQEKNTGIAPQVMQ
jgi:hypothetical protein